MAHFHPLTPLKYLQTPVMPSHMINKNRALLDRNGTEEENYGQVKRGPALLQFFSNS